MSATRRVVAAGLAAGLGFAAAGGSLLRVLPAYASNSCQPTISSISPQDGPQGQAFTVSGDNFNCGQSFTVKIGGSGPYNANPTSGTSFTFTPPAAVNGVVVVSGQATLLQGSGSGTSTQDLNYVTDPSAVNPGQWTPTAGQSLTVSGSNLNLGGQSVGVAISYANATTGSQCPPNQVVPAPSSATSFTFTAPGVYCSAKVTLQDIFRKNAGSSTPTLTVPILSSVPLTVKQSGGTSFNPAEAAARSTVHLTGSGFGNSGSAGAGFTPSSWSDTDIALTVPDAATSGEPLVVTRADGTSVYNGPGPIVDARVDSISPSTASDGDTVTITGGGFGTTTGTLALGNASPAAATWSPTSITFVVPADVQSGPVQITPKDTNPPASAPSLNIQAKLGGVSPSHAAGGSYIQITGTGFGSTQGTVTIAGYDMPVTAWGDSQIVVHLPQQAVAGHYPMVITPPGQSAVSTTFTVDPHPAAPGGTGTGSSSSSSSSSSSASATPGIPPLVNGLIPPGANGPIIAHGPVNFTRPVKPASPVNLTLATAADSADPGQDVPFTVTLIAFGKPVAGALVDLSVVVEPGTDARITPTQAKTDAQGRVSGVVHLSKTAGDHIILARSGTTSDEVRVVGRSADAAQNGSGVINSVTDVFTAGPSKMLLLFASGACLVLFLTGFGIQMVLPRRARSAAAVGTLAATAHHSLLWRVARLPQAVAVVVQFALMALIVVPAQLVARVVR